jgi:hypothetical protein
MKIEIGYYVRISGDFPGDKTLQNQTGNIEALPNKEHPDEYLVKLDGGPVLNPHFAGRLIRVPANCLELARRRI